MVAPTMTPAAIVTIGHIAFTFDEGSTAAGDETGGTVDCDPAARALGLPPVAVRGTAVALTFPALFGEPAIVCLPVLFASQPR